MTPKLTRTSRFTLDMDEDYARKVFLSIVEVLNQFDAKSPEYITLVNHGRIDTLVALRNLLAQEF